MSKYKVTFVRTLTLEKEIEAESQDDAEAWASEQGLLPDDFDDLQDTFDVEAIQEVPPTTK